MTEFTHEEVVTDIKAYVKELNELVPGALPRAKNGRQSLEHQRIYDLLAELEGAVEHL